MHLIMELVVGIGLSAACGFRVFVPLLGMSIASHSGHLTLAPGFEWIGSWPALVALATATGVEILAYYIPWLDNLMDTAAIPASIVAGTMITASQLADVSPFLKWSLAIIAGGGICGVIQTGTAITRAASTGVTGGFGNFVVSTLELFFAMAMTIMAFIAPVMALIVVFVLIAILGTQFLKWISKRDCIPGVGHYRHNRSPVGGE